MAQPYKGRKLAQGEIPTTTELQEMLDAVQQINVMRSSSHGIVTTPQGTFISDMPSPDGSDNARPMFSSAFFGRIVRGGPWPDGSPNNTAEFPDFADARYWVQELFVSDPLEIDPATEDDTLSNVKDDASPMEPRPYPTSREDPGDVTGPPDPMHTAQPTEDLHELADAPRRVVVATNLAEAVVAPPYDLPPMEVAPPTRQETHILGLDRFQEELGEIVLVFTWTALEGTPSFFFIRPPSGGRRFGVVVETFQPPGRTDLVRVQPVRVVEEDMSSRLEADGDPVLVKTTPNVPSMSYHSFSWPSTTFDHTTPIIFLSFISGTWYAEQTLRHRLGEIPRGVRFDDCTVPATG